MSRYFVTDAPVPLYEFEPGSVIGDDGQPTPPNVIWIRARMDVEVSGRVTNELVALDAKGKVALHAGANQLALLVHNILRWEGPDLSGVACTPENIRRLDPNDPHIAAVLEEIAERNKRRSAPDPKKATGSGSPAAGSHEGDPVIIDLDVATPGLSASGKPTSFSLRVLDGLQK